MFSIQEIVEKTGLSAHTLRYYEREGLIDPIGRDGNGYRMYDEHDLGRIQLLCCLRSTGMSVAHMQLYAQLSRAGDHTFDQRRALLESHREQVLAQMDELQSMLKLINHKIRIYTHSE